VNTTLAKVFRPMQLLLVDDSPGDVHLMKEAFRKAAPKVFMHVATNGMEAMAFLSQKGRHVDAPRPSLILLDLNLPKMDGREVLARIKADPTLKGIPTIVLTVSESELDIITSYRLHASCYLSKPVELDDFNRLVNSINEFWLKKVTFSQTA
jgi:chemotaxis family two-component system response regulator Rcp1